MVFNANYNPYPSARTVVYAKGGMVACSHPLAAQAGLEIIRNGGNAVDAAIATAACLTVVEPTSNGIGGDAFAIAWMNGKMYGLNGSGVAPRSISLEAVRGMGHETMPKFGWLPVTVPGVPGAWAALAERFGKLPLAQSLSPAIAYACDGHPIAPIVGTYWRRAFEFYKKHLTSTEFASWFDTFAPDGSPPQIGEIWKSAGHADTLAEIGESNAQSFYKGRLAEAIAEYSAKYGGFLTKEDLEEHTHEWVSPLSVNYRGYDVWELPPNGQGLVALIALNILKGWEYADHISAYHKQFEAIKLAFATGKEFVTDPRFMSVSVDDLLSETYTERLRAKISNTAAEPTTTTPNSGGTVYLATADGSGNMVSYIQSNYMGFGSGLVVPGTGIALQNRGCDFSLDPNQANALVGGKRSYHTIIPGFLTKNGEAVGPFGVMGGYMQPQGHVQVIMNTVDFELNPQMALDAPRWQWIAGKHIIVESQFPRHIAHELTERGHQIQMSLDSGSFGRGQIIWRNPKSGVLCGGTESRCDGAIASF